MVSHERIPGRGTWGLAMRGYLDRETWWLAMRGYRVGGLGG